MPVEWSGAGLRGLMSHIEGIPATMRKRAHEELSTIVSKAASQQKMMIEEAVTETGRRREAAGRGVPGRVETGLMMNSISASTTEDTTTGTSIEGLSIDEGGTIVGEWGWQFPEDYFTYQDDGTETVQAVLSLLTTFLAADSEFRGKLPEIINDGLKS